jgi:predicted pyridoxine 5'-phosphate oxidase superfamily flavin-nucleotide-binding protein
MSSIPEHVQEFFEGKLAWVATTSSNGIPNATPKGSVRIVDDEHLIFADLYSVKTRENLLENPQVAITVVDTETVEGYQVKGNAELIDSGPLFERMAEGLKNGPKERPPLQYVVLVTVVSVYDQSVGPNAGEQIA